VIFNTDLSLSNVSFTELVSRRTSMPYIEVMVIYTAMNTQDEFRNVSVMEVGVAGWVWLGVVGNCK